MTTQTSHPSAAAAATFDLRLYVAGQTAKSLAAVANLKRICEPIKKILGDLSNEERVLARLDV